MYRQFHKTFNKILNAAAQFNGCVAPASDRQHHQQHAIRDISVKLGEN